MTTRRRTRCARIHQSLADPRALLDPELLRTGMPPCMRQLFEKVRAMPTPRLSVKDRMAVAGWLAAMGFPASVSDATLTAVAFGGDDERVPLHKVQEMVGCIGQARKKADRAEHWSCHNIIRTSQDADTQVRCPYASAAAGNVRECQRACARAEGRPGDIYDPLDHLLHRLDW
jgi:hypothetical protein